MGTVVRGSQLLHITAEPSNQHNRTVDIVDIATGRHELQGTVAPRHSYPGLWTTANAGNRSEYKQSRVFEPGRRRAVCSVGGRRACSTAASNNTQARPRRPAQHHLAMALAQFPEVPPTRRVKRWCAVSRSPCRRGGAPLSTRHPPGGKRRVRFVVLERLVVLTRRLPWRRLPVAGRAARGGCGI